MTDDHARAGAQDGPRRAEPGSPQAGTFTVLALFYGDHADLARRLLDSLATRLPSPAVAEFRLGTNAISYRTDNVLRDFSPAVTPSAVDRDGVRFRRYDCAINARKYPAMRRALYEQPVATEYVMWFDDDSCLRLESQLDFFEICARQMRDADVMGQLWSWKLRPGQADWIRAQPWYAGKPVRTGQKVRFATGGWWCARTEVLRRFNYPFPELNHRGGDVMLGELCRQQGLRLKHWCSGVAINADEYLHDSKSPRRGYDEYPIGCR